MTSLVSRSAQRAGKRAWFQPFVHALNRRGIPRQPHTIDILSYTCDANTVTMRYNVRKFHGTHPAVDLKL